MTHEIAVSGAARVTIYPLIDEVIMPSQIDARLGRHTRMAVGVAALPYDVAVEVEGLFEVR